MTLTYGRAPFSSEPSGIFNFERTGPKIALFWEDFPKRLRVEINGEMVADSRQVKALHETGQLMRLCVPPEHVRMDLLQDTGRSKPSEATGAARCWSIANHRPPVKDVAWSYDNPPASASFIRGYLSFDLEAVDAWYQEDDKGYAHPRNPYHGFDIHGTTRHVIVKAHGTVLAESDRPRVLFETSLPPRYYLRPEDVRVELLEKSASVSACPYKGDGQHWHVLAGGQRIDDAAWSLQKPLGEAKEIADWFCFYPEKVEVEIDGQRLTA